MTRETPVGRIGLAMLFITALVTAQLTASKVLVAPLSVPFAQLLVPGGVLAYALTFFATDCYAELYGRREAQALVNVGFVMIFVMLGLVWFAIAMPSAGPPISVAPGEFATVLGASTSIVAGSLFAYIVSQNWDVYAFHRLREAFDGEYLWLRNVGSTATSQAIDTVLFVGIAFYLLPRFLDVGPQLPANAVLGLMVGQYVLKLLIAVVDTPFVYLVVGAVRGREPGHEGPIVD